MRSGVLPAPHLVWPSGQGQPPSAICVIRFESKGRTKLDKPVTEFIYQKCIRAIPLHNIRYQRIWCCCNIILVLSCNKHKCNSQRSSSLGLSVRKTKKNQLVGVSRLLFLYIIKQAYLHRTSSDLLDKGSLQMKSAAFTWRNASVERKWE